MCLVALFFASSRTPPWSLAPTVKSSTLVPVRHRKSLTDPPRILAGRDPYAGGTWLGVNEHGVLVAVTNRRKTPRPLAYPQPRPAHS